MGTTAAAAAAIFLPIYISVEDDGRAEGTDASDTTHQRMPGSMQKERNFQVCPRRHPLLPKPRTVLECEAQRFLYP